VRLALHTLLIQLRVLAGEKGSGEREEGREGRERRECENTNGEYGLHAARG